jgi:hypothetical protein
LHGHTKGLIDHKKDLNAATTANVKHMSQLAKITQRIGAKTAKLTPKLQQSQTETAQEAVLNSAARLYRRLAVQYRHCAEDAQDSYIGFSMAISGIVGWLEETGNVQQLKEYRPILESFKDAAVGARGHTRVFRDTLASMPNMSQRLNASRAELVDSVNVSLSMMDESIAFADQMLERLPN